jgi:hypothetical protein
MNGGKIQRVLADELVSAWVAMLIVGFAECYIARQTLLAPLLK